MVTLTGQWFLTQGWFLDKELVFEKYDPQKHKAGVLFEFNPKNKLRITTVNLCGTCEYGSLSITKSSWKQEENMLLLKVQGSRVPVMTFSYEITYGVATRKENLVLWENKRQNIWEKSTN